MFDHKMFDRVNTKVLSSRKRREKKDRIGVSQSSRSFYPERIMFVLGTAAFLLSCLPSLGTIRRNDVAVTVPSMKPLKKSITLYLPCLNPNPVETVYVRSLNFISIRSAVSKLVPDSDELKLLESSNSTWAILLSLSGV
jgi:hypothetical protein